ncbi:MAG: hypothetical protein PWQ46_788 [Methanomicrobiaceae archaeon]|nr:hypothetical protein [Methanomicrobiaceae archaeon]MDK2863078.1 hypothetical protein [Methanomicrobiaceae archaeon]
MSSITTEGCRASVGGWTVHRAALLLIFLALALLLLWSPAAAKIIVEPGPAELPTDGINVDDERFVPLWHYPPLELLTILLLIHCPLLAMPFEIICSAGVLAFLGYQTSRHPLDNKKRSRIYACIRDRPGITPAEITRGTGINRGTTRYHLSRLREAGLVSAVNRGGKVGYFQSGYDATSKTICCHLRNNIRREILTLLLDDPGITQSEIADDTGISRSAAAWHLQRLDADGLIESDRDGRAVRYALTDEALEIFVVLERGDHGRAC